MSPRLTRDGAAVPAADPYPVLRFRGDITNDLLPGQILGTDEFGRPFEVLDAEVDPVEVDGHYDGDGCLFPTPGHLRPVTTVFLQYATPETIARAVAELQALAGAR